MGKRAWLGVLGILCLLNAGCCAMAERWCGNRHHGPAYAPAACVPCTPAPVCCPTPAGSSPAVAPAWQRGPYGCP